MMVMNKVTSAAVKSSSVDRVPSSVVSRGESVYSRIMNSAPQLIQLVKKKTREVVSYDMSRGIISIDGLAMIDEVEECQIDLSLL